MPVREIVWAVVTLAGFLLVSSVVTPVLPARVTDAWWFVFLVLGSGLVVGDASRRLMSRSRPAPQDRPTA